MNILIKDIIHSNFAVSTDDGDKINRVLNDRFIKKESIILNFKGITLLTTSFLNAAIGKLYSNEKYTSDFLNTHITMINVESEDKHLFSMVIKRAKEYFTNKDEFEKNSQDSIYGNN